MSDPVVLVFGDPADDQLEDDLLILGVQFVVAQQLHQLRSRQLQHLVGFSRQLQGEAEGEEEEEEEEEEEDEEKE